MGFQQPKNYTPTTRMNINQRIIWREHLGITLKKLNNKFKFLITYDDCDEIREIYSWCNDILNKEWNYTIARTDDQKRNLKLSDGHIGKREKGKEIFITNYLQTEVEGLKQEKYYSDNMNQPLLTF